VLDTYGARLAPVRRAFLVAFTAFFLLGAAWAVALPVNGTYDERQHVVRAYAVVTGQWLPERDTTQSNGYVTGMFRAPASLLPGDVDCTWRPPRRPASCQGPAGGPARVDTTSMAGRYSPVYYAPVGLPLLLWPTPAGVVLARLVSALLSALLLAAAAGAAARLGRAVLMGLALVATPMAMNLNGSVNPNGVEIAAGVLLFATLLALLRADGLDARSTRRLLVGAGTAAALLLTVRQLGPVLLVMIVVAALAVARPGRVAALWRRRDARLVLGGFGLAGVAFLALWTVVSGIAAVPPAPGRGIDAGPAALLRLVARYRVPFYLHQAVGQFSYGETTISRYAIDLWYALCALPVLAAAVTGGWRVRAALGWLAGASLALLVALEVHFAPLIGWSQHGRYALPAAVGIVLVATAADRVLGWLADRPWAAVAVALATLPVQVYALARVMTRFQLGPAARLDPLHGSWRPPTGPVLPLLAAVLGAALLAWLCGPTLRSAAVDAPSPGVIGRPPGDPPRLSTTEATTH
jgi:predicted membrane protein DUF2142